MKFPQYKSVSLFDNLKNKKKSIHQLVTLIVFSTILYAGLPFTLNKVSAAGTISGTVYVDYNMNGTRDTSGIAPNYAIDSGVNNVTVTVYAPNGASKSATTNSVGAYSIDTSAAPALPSGPYRLEFTSLPSGFNPSAVGTNNASSVRFVADGDNSNVDFGIVNNLIYSENDPLMATSCYVNGNPLGGGTSGTMDALVAFPYSNSGEGHKMKTLALASETGATWGLAWQSSRNRLFTAATVKRHVGLGPQGLAGIYVTTFNNGTSSTSSFVDLASAPYNLNVGTISNNATRGLPNTLNSPSHDVEAFAKVGKVGIGDIDVSEDGNTLWGVNLNNAATSIFKMDISGASPGAFTNYPLSSITGVPTCTNGVFRPWALEFHKGTGYLGGVCTAENVGGTRSNLSSVVVSFNPNSPTAFTTVFNAALDYNKGTAYLPGDGATTPANTEQWYPWTDTYSDAGFNRPTSASRLARPMPILADIEIDQNDAMSLSFVDRAGSQLGYGNYLPNPADTTTFIAGFSSGDLVRGCPNGSGGWNIETNGSCGTSSGSGIGNNEGNGGGEFYGLDLFSSVHEEIITGGSAHLPGSNELASISFDPTVDVSAAGPIYFNTTNGARNRGFQVFGNGVNTGNGLFGKANGLGDMELMKSSAPLEIGNLVWNDANQNGVQDPNELGIPNVVVQLWADTDGNGTIDAQVGTTNTDANGNYKFGGVDNTNMLSNSSQTCTKTAYSQVSSSNDDGREVVSTGAVANNFTNLAMGYRSATDTHVVGYRFQNVNVPQNANITAASLVFTAFTADSGTANLKISGQAADNPPAFSTTAFDISGRTQTTAMVNWSNVPNWTGAGEVQGTPSVSSIVQELVDRGGWNSGNSMVFTVRENGSTANVNREARSFDVAGNGSGAVLAINYTENCSYTVNPNTAHQVRILSSNFTLGNPLFGRIPSLANNDGTANGDSRDSDGTLSSGNVIVNFTSGDMGQNNHTYDFGFHFAPTAADVSVGGRTLSTSGRALSNVSVYLIEPDGTLRQTTSNVFGYYRFNEVESGQTYVIGVSSKRYVFKQESQAITAKDDMMDVHFYGGFR